MKKEINQPNPDFSRFRKAVLCQGEPDRLPFVELFVDPEIMGTLLEEPLSVPELKDSDSVKKYIRQQIRYWYEYGYDYVSISLDLGMPLKRVTVADTASLSRGKREWVDQSVALIKNWEDFEKYPWPEPRTINYFPIEYAARNLPSGMKIIEWVRGILQWTLQIMGFENFSYILIDQPELVENVFKKIGNVLVHMCSTLADMDKVGALWVGDDMGYRSGTLISPQLLRKYIFPWYKKIADIAHAHELPFLFHSCGNLEEIMNDLIDFVGIDAKHSFEDAIMPVTEVKKKYGNRICVLGGVDMDLLARGETRKVRDYVRRVIQECAPGGGYCLGTGNSVANYLKIENYVAMLDEGWKHGKYPIEV